MKWKGFREVIVVGFGVSDVISEMMRDSEIFV